ncbi:hypothetical protein FRC02_001049 [Tulasnella sp. 418]|nr:hypothetical protein FRC02_001049 [Tulasnella sp. 418]
MRKRHPRHLHGHGPLRLDTATEDYDESPYQLLENRRTLGREVPSEESNVDSDEEVATQDDDPPSSTTATSSPEDEDSSQTSNGYAPPVGSRPPASSRMTQVAASPSSQLRYSSSQVLSYYAQTSYRPISSLFTFSSGTTLSGSPSGMRTSSESLEEFETEASRSSSTSKRLITVNSLPPTTMIRSSSSSVHSSTITSDSVQTVATSEVVATSTPPLSRVISSRSNVGGIIKPTSTSSAEGQQSSRGSSHVAPSVIVAVVIGTFIAVILSWLAIRYQVKKRQEEDDMDQDMYSTRSRMRSEFGFSPSEKGVGMNSGPSWVSGGYGENLVVPDPPSFDGRYSKRGSGWMVLSENYAPGNLKRNVNNNGIVRQPPGAYVSPRRSPHEYDGESRSSQSSEDAVITTASRISARSGNTAPASLTSASGRPPLAVINKSPSGLSTASSSTSPSYHQDVYRYDTDTQTNIRKVKILEGKQPPSNTMIGAASARGVLKTNTSELDARARGAMDGFKEGLSTRMARAREPLNIIPKGNKTLGGSGYAISTPRRAYHISTSFENDEDEDPFVHDLPSESSKYSIGKEAHDSSDQGFDIKYRKSRDLVRAAGLSTPTITQPSSPVSSYPDSPGRESRSFGKVMMTDYGADGAILPSFVETPHIGIEDSKNYNDSSRFARASSEWRCLTPSLPRHGASSQISSTSQQSGANRAPVPPMPACSATNSINVNNNTATPRLTVTSPSNGHIQRLSFSQSSSAEGAFMPLSQMALANLHPDYRSPTYSVYNMYDGDDEGSGMPRKSLVGLKPR